MNVSATRPQLLPTSVVGRHGLPGWERAGVDVLTTGEMGWVRETPRWVVKHKLAALVQGARIVGKELGG